MSTQEEARELMAKSRQDEENIEQNMLSRAEAEVESSSTSQIDEESRELMAKQREHDRHLKNSLLSRSEAEISNS
ncbi:MAG: hypothetical protein ACFCU5_00670 [Pleurocapsa sp.]